MASLCGRRLTKQLSEISAESELGEAQKFSYLSLQDATNNFSKHNLIGDDGLAQIYRGVLPNRTLVAVRKYRRKHDFASPPTVEILSCLRHPNIDRVIGYCFYKEDRLLVYKYVSNCTLRDLLIDEEKREFVFNWPMRVAVCNGIARGLHHLHQQTNPCFIHRDIKPDNILLDSNFTPKITGFDIVKYVYESPLEEEEEDYDIVRGTIGYLDPEYIQTSKCTPKSDVYSFGVVMLEIITGRKALELIDGESIHLVEWALDLLVKDRVWELVDPVLADFSVDQVLGFMDVAFHCLEKRRSLRPSMGEVIQMLNRMCDSPLASFELQQPDTPYFSAASSFRSSMAQTYDEIEGESSILDGELSVELKETTKLQPQEEQQHAGITVLGSYEVKSQSQTTMVFERPTAGRGEYAAYWRKKNMMPRNKA